MSLSMEERLKRRKLDALKRGVHRATGGEALAVSTHLVGIGRAGAGIVAEALRRLEPGAPKLTALVVDIGEQDLTELRALAEGLSTDVAEVTIIALEVPGKDELTEALRHYPEFLTLEYPRRIDNPSYQPWLEQSVQLPRAGDHVRRAVAKAIYGRAYYAPPRTIERALRAFAAGIEAGQSQVMVAMVFGMGGGTGSGIAVDLARHLSTCMFGRRVLMAGIGIAPCGGDVPERDGGAMYALLNELDIMSDETKSRGVVMSCGELFRNPFTAGFIMVQQDQVWQASHDLAETQRRGTQEVASLLTTGGGTNLWELLRLLNWVAAPSTQHSAARTPWGARWIHMLGFADITRAERTGTIVTIDQTLMQRLGLLSSYTPEFVELRVAGLDEAVAASVAADMAIAVKPDVAPNVIEGGYADSVQFILPSISKIHLSGLTGWRSAYESETLADKLLDHSLLLEQGILLSEPSTRIAGMAGASLWGGDSWIAVPLASLRGDELPATVPALRGVQELRNAV